MYISVDVESDGPCPGLYSMVSFGAVAVDRKLDKTFYGQCRPLANALWIKEALAMSRITRQQHEEYPDTAQTIYSFYNWLQDLKQQNVNANLDDKLIFITDNLAFDWQFINYYFNLFALKNPFGFSGRRIGDIWAGWCGDMRKASEWKKFRKTKHTHNPVDDAKGNAEALLYIMDQMYYTRKQV